MYKPKKLPAIDAIAFGIQGSINQMRIFFFMALIVLAMGLLVGGTITLIIRFSTAINFPFGLSFPDIFLHQKFESIMYGFRGNFPWLLLLAFVIFAFISWAITGIIKILLEITDQGYSSAQKMLTVNFLEIVKVFCAFTIWLVVLIIGLACFIIPGVIWFIRSYFYLYFIIDKNDGVFSSFLNSVDVTKDYGWQLLGYTIFIYAFRTATFQLSSMLTGLSTAYLYRKLSSELLVSQPREV